MRFNTYNTYSSPSYGQYRRHAHIFLGWDASFKADGKRWTWKLRPHLETKMDAEDAIFERFPNATEIKLRKIICEE
jgi:hypothetical protein